ncbi:MAG TPA: hypothetical protein VKH41_12005 [Myxococcota bacterium]|nr:hypothetical protein [Myxococcota bacterium]
MAKLMMTLQLDPGEASIEAVRRKLELGRLDLDEEFGVVPIDPEKDLFAILVDERVASELMGREGVRGPFSNPKIEPFGPPSR